VESDRTIAVVKHVLVEPPERQNGPYLEERAHLGETVARVLLWASQEAAKAATAKGAPDAQPGAVAWSCPTLGPLGGAPIQARAVRPGPEAAVRAPVKATCLAASARLTSVLRCLPPVQPT
jgi:hypothetical protein